MTEVSMLALEDLEVRYGAVPAVRGLYARGRTAARSSG